MKRRGFLKKFVKAAAVVAVAPTALAAVEKVDFIRQYPLTEAEAFCVQYQGRPYFYTKGIADAAERFRTDMELQLLLGRKDR